MLVSEINIANAIAITSTAAMVSFLLMLISFLIELKLPSLLKIAPVAEADRG